MIVDTSALIAIGLAEPDAHLLLAAMREAELVCMSAGSLIETRIVAFGKGGETLLQAVNKNIAEIPIDIIAVTPSQADRADAAYRIYGRGSGHPAKLNFGDCFTYALAAEMDEPILCKGDDLIHTDRAIVRV